MIKRDRDGRRGAKGRNRQIEREREDIEKEMEKIEREGEREEKEGPGREGNVEERRCEVLVRRRRSEWLPSEPETDELMLETTGGTCFRASNDLASATARRWVLTLMMAVVAKVTAAYPGATCVCANSNSWRRRRFHSALVLASHWSRLTFSRKKESSV